MQRRTLLATSACAVVLVLGLVVSACGSSSGGSSSSATEAASTTENSGSGGQAGLQAATKFADKFLKEQTSIGIETPLEKAPPTGKHVYWLQGAQSDTQTIGTGFKAATKVLGWELTILPYNPAQPQQINSVMQEAVDRGADYIAISGQPVAVFQQALSNAKAKGIPVFDSYAPEAPEGKKNGLYTEILGPAQYRLYGEITGNWAISDSEGKAQELFVQLGEYPILEPLLEGEEAAFAENCPDECGLDVMQVSIEAFSGGQIPTQVVAYLQKHPEVDYLRFAIGAMTNGVTAALNSAGLGQGVKIFGDNPELANMQALADKTESAWVAVPLAMSAWYMVDGMARYSVGESLDPTNEATVSAQLFTQENVPTPVEQWGGPANYEAQFTKLWQK